MTPQNGAPKDTLYEQVLDFARREIEDASSQMDALLQSLRLVEARVEAAKSVYEAVAARLNLEDELEEEAQLDSVPNVPAAPPMPAAEAGNNGSADGFSMDLIRKHLEERDKAAQNAAQTPLRAPEPEGSEVTSEPEPEPAAVAPSLPPEPASAEGGKEGSSGGFPGLSEADRALIGEYLRSKRDG